jgi:hypothetical protein
MSQAPFSKPDVNDVVSSSPVCKIHPSLNHWSRRRLFESRGKHLFGIVVFALLLLGLQLTACGNAATSNNGSASPTSNSTSQPNTPSNTSSPGSTSPSTSTTGPTTTVPTTGPTIGLTFTPTTVPTSTPKTVPTSTPKTVPTSTPTAVPTADPSSFTVSLQGYSPDATAGQKSVLTQTITLFNGSQSGVINWTVSTSTNDGGGWLSFSSGGGTLQPNTSNDYQIIVTVSKDMKPGTYNGTVQFHPNGTINVVPVDLTIT